MTKVVGIGGSPRAGGNTDMLLDEALKGSKQAGATTEKIALNGLDFKPCQECGGCDKTGVCVIKDDMGIIYKALEASDAIIIASPIFFGTISAQVKMMIDRLQCLWAKKHLLKEKQPSVKKRGIFICVSGMEREDFFENARKIIRIFFSTAGAEYFGEFCRGNIEEKGSIANDSSAMKEVYKLGRALVGNR